MKFVMCTLVSRDSMPFCKYVKRHVYPGDQGTRDKLNQIHAFFSWLDSMNVKHSDFFTRFKIVTEYKYEIPTIQGALFSIFLLFIFGS